MPEEGKIVIMDGLRFYFAMAVSKLMVVALKLLGRNASYLPGLAALKICPDFIGRLQKPEHLLCVTGTNGKTTTSNFVASALRDAGKQVTNNSFGSNVAAGIATALLTNSTFTGKHKNEYAVLEVDERSSPRVYPFITPDYLICNNIMRDSVKRNAHTEFITYILDTSIPAETKLILNADDPICAGIAPQCKDRLYFGVDAEIPAAPESTAACSLVYCPVCGAKLETEYLRFNHIGRWKCTSCDFASPARNSVVTEIDRKNGTFTVSFDGHPVTFRLVSDNIVNIFNFCGAATLLRQVGLTDAEIAHAFENAAVVNTRYEKKEVNGISITMILTKGQNPVACSRVFSYVASCPGEHKCVLMLFDDKEDNIRNSENCSWLFDLDYTPLKSESIDQLIFAGKRYKDHILRAAMTGIPKEKILTTDSVKDCSALVDLNTYKDVYVLYDNYFLDEARREEKLLIERGERLK